MVVLGWWRMSSRGGGLLGVTLFGLSHDVSADECIIDRVADLLMHGIRKPHASVLDKTHNEIGKSEASISFTFALEGYFLQLMGKGSSYIHLYALKNVVNERAYFNHTVRKVAIGDDIIEEEFLNDLGRVG